MHERRMHCTHCRTGLTTSGKFFLPILYPLCWWKLTRWFYTHESPCEFSRSTEQNIVNAGREAERRRREKKLLFIKKWNISSRRRLMRKRVRGGSAEKFSLCNNEYVYRWSCSLLVDREKVFDFDRLARLLTTPLSRCHFEWVPNLLWRNSTQFAPAKKSEISHSTEWPSHRSREEMPSMADTKLHSGLCMSAILGIAWIIIYF